MKRFLNVVVTILGIVFVLAIVYLVLSACLHLEIF